MRRLFISMLLAAGALVSAASAKPPAKPPAVNYTQCVDLVGRNPALAEEQARSWQQQGGGWAAVHCHALALSALKHYAEAAHEFEAVARAKGMSGADRAALLDQAGNAWLLTQEGRNALRDFTAALILTPDDTGILVDRARAFAMLRNWKGADRDLSAVLLQDQNRSDVLVLRASARWAMNDKDGAARDIVRALQLYPDYPPALLERGNMKYSIGDNVGARDDWKKAAATGQGATAADAHDKLVALEAEMKRNHPLRLH